MIEDERQDTPDEQPAPGGAEGEDAALDPSQSADPGESPAAGEEGDEAPVPAEAAEEPAAEEAATEEPAAEEPATEEPAAEEPAEAGAAAAEEGAEGETAAEGEAPAEERPQKDKRKKGEDKKEDEVIPGAHLAPDLVLEPERTEEDELARYAAEPDAEGEQPGAPAAEAAAAPAARSALDLAADARYQATGKRKTAVARVILRPGDGSYSVNGRSLEEFFPRAALQKAARQPLEVAGFERRMNVVARIHGGGVAAQAGALRHGVARALVEADPNLRPELKRRGLLTRDARAKERKKAGLKKARKRPQFSKR
jgi:small subunit ribosomal protein S9